ncbi:MAG TPA: A24 family peptidase [Myxococcales bacterium]|nr:A24 family peptidase [Myxococcales bacterium]
MTLVATLVVTAIALAVSVVTDLRQRRILNWVTIPALVLVIGLLGTAGGWPLVEKSLIGMAVCAVPMVLAALPGWIGMGDAKLIAVCGAAAGFPAAVTVLLFVTVAGGLQATISLAAARIRGSAPPQYIPYACSIAAGAIASFLFPVVFP